MTKLSFLYYLYDYLYVESLINNVNMMWHQKTRLTTLATNCFYCIYKKLSKETLF